MGLLSTIGKIAGTAIGTVIGGPTGGAIGGKIGGAVGGAVDGKKKPASSTTAQAQPYIQSPSTSLADLRSASSGSSFEALKARSGDVKVAKTAEVDLKNGILSDPWQPTRDWYTDLGGDGSKIKIDETLLP